MRAEQRLTSGKRTLAIFAEAEIWRQGQSADFKSYDIFKKIYGGPESSNGQLTTWLKIQKNVTTDFPTHFVDSEDVFRF